MGVIAFAFVIAFMVKASHATGAAAILPYLIPVLGVWIYWIKKRRVTASRRLGRTLKTIGNQ